MVRLQPSAATQQQRQSETFNPTMVRLQRLSPSPIAMARTAFNPTMVRLQLPSLVPVIDELEGLSIPLWCDCNSLTGPC